MSKNCSLPTFRKVCALTALVLVVLAPGHALGQSGPRPDSGRRTVGEALDWLGELGRRLSEGPPPLFVMVPMEDGTRLATDCYVPPSGGPFPALLARSTYGRGTPSDARTYNPRGYAVVLQDVRGMGDSEGEKNVFYTDGWREGLQDGRDTVAWIRAQPWSNGQVVTYGGSALGITQVLLAPTVELDGQFIDVACSSLYGQLSYQGGVWRKCMCDGWLAMLGLFETKRQWQQHPSYDAYWADFNAEAQAAKVTAPALHFTGWYDIFTQGAIDNFVSRQEHGGEGARGRQRLIIKPIAHGPYPPDMPYTLPEDYDAVQISKHRDALLEYWVRGAAGDVADFPPVYYYTMGDDTDPDAPGMEWRTAQQWPPFPTTPTRLFLAEDGLLTTAAPAGALEPAAFTYDPADPFPTHGGRNLILPSGPFDQRVCNEGRTDYLVFATAPLEAPVEATGRVTAALYVSTDAPDTDFTAKLVDVFPEGDEREILVADGIQRLRYREGFETPQLMTPGGAIVRVEVDLWSVSWVFNTGHRIGLQISSSNYPRFDKNLNTGADFSKRGEESRAARNAVHRGGSHPSALVLPVRPPDVTPTLAKRLNPEL